MPKARILSHQIDKDSIETLDQKDGLFNPVKVEDVRNFDSVSQDAMEERAIENGILDKAFENAKNIIRKIIDNDFVEELGYTVCFATVYKGNIIKNLIMDCQSYTKYRPNETTGGIFVSWRRKEELPTGA